jgi:hypothetical protein
MKKKEVAVSVPSRVASMKSIRQLDCPRCQLMIKI